MAQFYGEITGQRTTIHTIGSKKSGIIANIRGWNYGIHIKCKTINGRDVFHVYKTGGSNNINNIELIYTNE
jgi:hypothetical protein